jgi:hypothetical protein
LRISRNDRSVKVEFPLCGLKFAWFYAASGVFCSAVVATAASDLIRPTRKTARIGMVGTKFCDDAARLRSIFVRNGVNRASRPLRPA